MKVWYCILFFAAATWCGPSSAGAEDRISEFPAELRNQYTAKTDSIDRLYNFCTPGDFFSIQRDPGLVESKSRLSFKIIFLEKEKLAPMGGVSVDRTVSFDESLAESDYVGSLVFFSNSTYDLVLELDGGVESTSNTGLGSSIVKLVRKPCP